MCYLRNFCDIRDQQTVANDAFGENSASIVINGIPNFIHVTAFNESCFDSKRGKPVCEDMS
jgi:hypothetical protein